MEEKLKLQEYENYVLSWIFCLKNWNLSNVNRRGIFRANIRVFFHFSGKETNILLRAFQLIIRIGIRESSVMLSFDPLKFCQSVLILQFFEQSTFCPKLNIFVAIVSFFQRTDAFAMSVYIILKQSHIARLEEIKIIFDGNLRNKASALGLQRNQ